MDGKRRTAARATARTVCDLMTEAMRGPVALKAAAISSPLSVFLAPKNKSLARNNKTLIPVFS
jgi:hypothetical protein